MRWIRRPTEFAGAGSAAPRRGAGASRIRERGRQVARVLRQVLGFPDYAAYLEHCRRAGHPPRFTEREFLDACFAARARSRCC